MIRNKIKFYVHSFIFRSKAKPQIVLSNYRRQFSVTTSLLAYFNTKFKRQYICNKFYNHVIKLQKQPSVYSNWNNPYLRSMKLTVTMFFFCILSAAEKITSSINKDFGKCSPQSFSVRRELFEIHTLKIKSFQNITWLSHSSNN